MSRCSSNGSARKKTCGMIRQFKTTFLRVSASTASPRLRCRRGYSAARTRKESITLKGPIARYALTGLAAIASHTMKPNQCGAANDFRTSRPMRPTAFARMGRAVLQSSLTLLSLAVASCHHPTMRFLTSDQWQAWCVARQVPLREAGWIRPDIGADHFHIADLPYPPDSGPKVTLARRLFSL